MKVGILGSGDVGKVLGKGFANRGHEVMLASRTPDSENVVSWLEETGKGCKAGTFEETAAFGNLLVLAVSWSGCENAIQLAGQENFTGKIVMDVTNPLVFEEDKLPSLAIGHTDSGGEQVQRWLPESRVVKVFNTVGNVHMVNPKFPGGPPDMFICGNDERAKSTVQIICKEFGWPVIDIGGIEGSRELEPLCILWVKYGIMNKTWNHAFKLLKK